MMGDSYVVGIGVYNRKERQTDTVPPLADTTRVGYVVDRGRWREGGRGEGEAGGVCRCGVLMTTTHTVPDPPPPRTSSTGVNK